MLDKEQRMTEAAMRYLALLDRGQSVSILEFVATADADLRDELEPYLELTLAIGDIAESAALSAEEQVLVDAASQRVHARFFGQAAAQPRTLTKARKERRLGINALAKRLNLPPDLLARIERGGVQSTSIPTKLIARIAEALNQTEAAIRAMLVEPIMSTAGIRLSAQDGTVTRPEDVVSFVQALQESGATADQRAEWETER